jgi:ubiquinone/menaquinone biosynthesis C-methylase UbiE
MDYLASGFASVDASNKIEKFTQCLKLLNSLAFFQNYKQKTFDLLQLFEGAAVLEVGCGTGEDAIALAKRVGNTGRIVAIDHSRAMIAQAIESAKGLDLPIEFRLGEAEKLPFEDNEFYAARVDRTLQHIPEPQTAIAQMARVVCSGGHIVAMEPDWETFTVNSQNRNTTRQLLNFWCDSLCSGWVGRNLSKYFKRAGLIDIQARPETLIITQLDLADKVFDLFQTADRAQRTEFVSQQEARDWLNELQQLDQSQEFFCSFTGFIVSGKKR